VLEKAFLNNNHFKSGITEAVMYQACGFLSVVFRYLIFYNGSAIVGLALAVSLRIRYLDIYITNCAAILSFAYALFFNL